MCLHISNKTFLEVPYIFLKINFRKVSLFLKRYFLQVLYISPTLNNQTLDQWKKLIKLLLSFSFVVPKRDFVKVFMQFVKYF